MRNVMPVALISASTVGSIRPGGGGGAAVAMSAARPSHIEDRKAFEKWNRLRFLAGFGSASLFVARHKTVGIDHSGAAFTFADVATQ